MLIFLGQPSGRGCYEAIVGIVIKQERQSVGLAQATPRRFTLL